MELRFLKGNWEFGKYKLQYRCEYDTEDVKSEWKDVPTVEQPKVCKCCGTPFPPEQKICYE